MRYITIPPSIDVPGFVRQTPQPDGSVEIAPTPFGLTNVILDFFVSNPVWRRDLATRKALIELVKAFNGKAPGDAVAIEDATCELLLTCDREQKWGPAFEFPVAVLMLSVLSAPKDKPEAEKKKR